MAARHTSNCLASTSRACVTASRSPGNGGVRENTASGSAGSRYFAPSRMRPSPIADAHRQPTPSPARQPRLQPGALDYVHAFSVSMFAMVATLAICVLLSTALGPLHRRLHPGA